MAYPYPPSPLDGNQVLQHAFDDAQQCLRVCIVDGTVGPGGGIEVIIDHTEDSIRLGNGANFFTSTTDGGKIGLDVNVINDIEIDIDATSGDNILVVGQDGVDLNPLRVDDKGQAYTNDSLDCGGINTIITVTDTPVEIKVGASRKADRKAIYARPLDKGIHWGFQNSITADETATGGDPLFRYEPLSITATANTAVYLVGPASGVKVFISEA